MSIPTCNVQTVIRYQSGEPVPGAAVVVRLDRTDRYQGFVVPERWEGNADEDGAISIPCFPNVLGSAGSRYQFTARDQEGRVALNVFATVPNQASADLHAIADSDPPPTLNDAEVAQLAAENAAALALTRQQAADASATAAAGSATSAGTSATAAGNSATAASGSADSAASNAGIASDAATAAGTSETAAAGSATSAAASATAAGNSATAAAGSATTAGAAQTAAEAAQTASAGSATAAGIAQTAAEAAQTAAETAQGNAEGEAAAAAASATAAGSSASAASASATAAATSETNAGNSATAAAGSATAAAGSASGAQAAVDNATATLSTLPSKTVAATTYTLLAEDLGKLLVFTAATDVTVTIPTIASDALADGWFTPYVQLGAGQVILSPAGGAAELQTFLGADRTAGQNAWGSIARAGSVYLAGGDLV